MYQNLQGNQRGDKQQKKTAGVFFPAVYKNNATLLCQVAFKTG
jgi:hypothetical protein